MKRHAIYQKEILQYFAISIVDSWSADEEVCYQLYISYVCAIVVCYKQLIADKLSDQ